jgi:hypothetical protein
LGPDDHLVWKIAGKAIKVFFTSIAHCSIVVICFMLGSRNCLLGPGDHLVWKIAGKAIKAFFTSIAHCSIVVIYLMLSSRNEQLVGT